MSSQDFTDWESASQIDPLILRLLQKQSDKPAARQVSHPVKQRRLCVLYAAVIGVSAMILVILLGVIRSTDVNLLLTNGCRSLLVFSVIGFIAGLIAEMCVRDAAKSMIREMLQRTDDLHSGPTDEMS